MTVGDRAELHRYRRHDCISRASFAYILTTQSFVMMLNEFKRHGNGKKMAQVIHVSCIIASRFPATRARSSCYQLMQVWTGPCHASIF